MKHINKRIALTSLTSTLLIAPVAFVFSCDSNKELDDKTLLEGIKSQIQAIAKGHTTIKSSSTFVEIQTAIANNPTKNKDNFATVLGLPEELSISDLPLSGATLTWVATKVTGVHEYRVVITLKKNEETATLTFNMGYTLTQLEHDTDVVEGVAAEIKKIITEGQVYITEKNIAAIDVTNVFLLNQYTFHTALGVEEINISEVNLYGASLKFMKTFNDVDNTFNWKISVIKNVTRHINFVLKPDDSAQSKLEYFTGKINATIQSVGDMISPKTAATLGTLLSDGERTHDHRDFYTVFGITNLNYSAWKLFGVVISWNVAEDNNPLTFPVKFTISIEELENTIDIVINATM